MWGCPGKNRGRSRRKRIKETMGKMLPEGFGVIVRHRRPGMHQDKFVQGIPVSDAVVEKH
ncbi:MAG: hypothetical protein R2860_01805 [Desulfobacterales bacterium]